MDEKCCKQTNKDTDDIPSNATGEDESGEESEGESEGESENEDESNDDDDDGSVPDAAAYQTPEN